ncbi:oxygen-independent coproporphyrinogen III oxidase [Microvirga antarctica]|uniref:oxygen-independent coproporphyrinogen III oxidase n=1 Tax=Microvirga antarctica TaxID=2819233 RepID=UPI001B3065FE|nr:oxygen-independent coproporphyrinogen III oxidase [Microvirga antarctica]
MGDEVALRYASVQVPRYTSYPTAAEFTDAVTTVDHARWLRHLDGDESVSVYLHVPYCRDLCFYCGCHAKVARRADVIAAYRETLEAEIALVAAQVTSPLRIAHLHWGGGTPSILGADGLASVLAALSRGFLFEDGFEHAIELDPRQVDAALAARLVAMGVNRVSLGVQDLDPRVQEAIGRIQPVGVVEAAISHLRKAGIEKLNVDLIFGLPHQTSATLRETCAVVGALAPDRIACYGYAHLPQRKANQRLIDDATLPGAAERFEQAETVARAFAAQGYVPIGIDHFAKPDDPLALAASHGRLHRNFQGYTDDDSTILLGFGASSISRFPDGYVQNLADVGAYRRRIEEGRLGSARGCRLSDVDRARARIIEALMCNFAVDLNEMGADDDFADELALLRPLAADGLLTIDHNVVRMTASGRPVVRVAASVFDGYRPDGTAGFSRAV